MKCLPVTGSGVQGLSLSPQVEKSSQPSRFNVFSDGIGVRLGETMTTLRVSNAVLKMKQAALRVQQYFPRAIFFLPLVTGVVGKSCSKCMYRTYSSIDFSLNESIVRATEYSLSKSWIIESAAVCNMIAMNESSSGTFENLACLCITELGEGNFCELLELSGINVDNSLKSCLIDAFSRCERAPASAAELKVLGIVLGVLFGSFALAFCISASKRDAGTGRGYVEL